MPFVKLDCHLLNSSLWSDREAREMFITALLMASPVEFEDSLEQLDVRTMKPTGWSVPPGRYGFIAASGSGIVRQCGIDAEAGLSALERLGTHDNDSKDPEYDGRRLVRVNGGYVALNYCKYRDFDPDAKLRMRQMRTRRKAAGVTPNTHAVTANNPEQERTRSNVSASASVSASVGPLEVGGAGEGTKPSQGPRTAGTTQTTTPDQIARPGEAGEQPEAFPRTGWSSNRDAVHIAQRWAAVNPRIFDPAKASHHFERAILAGVNAKDLMAAVESMRGRKPFEIVDAVLPKAEKPAPRKMTQAEQLAEIQRYVDDPEALRRATQ